MCGLRDISAGVTPGFVERDNDRINSMAVAPRMSPPSATRFASVVCPSVLLNMVKFV